jgi:hypothetical protein
MTFGGKILIPLSTDVQVILKDCKRDSLRINVLHICPMFSTQTASLKMIYNSVTFNFILLSEITKKLSAFTSENFATTE